MYRNSRKDIFLACMQLLWSCTVFLHTLKNWSFTLVSVKSFIAFWGGDRDKQQNSAVFWDDNGVYDGLKGSAEHVKILCYVRQMSEWVKRAFKSMSIFPFTFGATLHAVKLRLWESITPTFLSWGVYMYMYLQCNAIALSTSEMLHAVAHNNYYFQGLTWWNLEVEHNVLGRHFV